MKTILLSIFILLVVQTTAGQVKHTKKTIKPRETIECIHRFNLTSEQRLKEYPFNKAVQIQLVSFQQKDDTTEYILGSVPIKNGTLSMSRVTGLITMNNSQIDKLTDLLFNVGLKGDTYTFSISTAVGLDGGILFIDSKNKIFESIDICFDCGEIEIRTSKVRKNIGLPCIEKMGKLKSFFIASGLKY